MTAPRPIPWRVAREASVSVRFTRLGERCLDPSAYPCDDRHRHRVPERLVALGVRRWLPPVFDVGPPVGEALEPFALEGREPPHLRAVHHVARLLHAGPRRERAGAGAVPSDEPELVATVLAERDRGVLPGVGGETPAEVVPDVRVRMGRGEADDLPLSDELGSNPYRVAGAQRADRLRRPRGEQLMPLPLRTGMRFSRSMRGAPPHPYGQGALRRGSARGGFLSSFSSPSRGCT